MRKLLFLLLMAGSLTVSAQSNDYLVSMQGIGVLKIGMTQAELEKLLNKKFTLPNILDKDGSWLDTVKTKYKKIDVELYLERRYSDETNFVMTLMGVRTNSPLAKTQTGIGIGTDKLKIINTYEHNAINLWPEFEDDTYTVRSKTRSVIQVASNEGENMIVFYMNNKKVVGMEVTYFYGE